MCPGDLEPEYPLGASLTYIHIYILASNEKKPQKTSIKETEVLRTPIKIYGNHFSLPQRITGSLMRVFVV